MNGFAPAAVAVAGRLFVSVDDGSVYGLNLTGTGWDPVGRATPRIVHRLLPAGDSVLIVGGAAGGRNADLIERLPLP